MGLLDHRVSDAMIDARLEFGCPGRVCTGPQDVRDLGGFG